jgi:hypothetical protein
MDTCMSGQLCVPNPFLTNPDYTFPTCRTAGLFSGRDGVCVPDCLVSGLEAAILGRSTCAAGELCAPCTNPITGASTGACG